MNTEALLQDLIGHLRSVLGTSLDAPVQTGAANVSGLVWRVRLANPGQPATAISFEQGGAEAFARVLAGSDKPTEDVVRKSLRELCANVAATMNTANHGGGAIATEIDGPQLVEFAGPADVLTAGFTSDVLTEALIVAVAVEPPTPARAAASRAAGAEAAPPFGDPTGRLDVLLDIDLPLLVRFGGTQLPLKTLARLGPGSLIDLSRAPDDPVEMLVGGRVVARGEVVMVSGNYGIRVLEVVGGREGVRGVEPR